MEAQEVEAGKRAVNQIPSDREEISGETLRKLGEALIQVSVVIGNEGMVSMNSEIHESLSKVCAYYWALKSLE